MELSLATCIKCGRCASAFAGRYRDFLLDAGTLFTAASGLFLVAAVATSPSGVASSAAPEDAGTPLYLAAALVGSSYVWWSALRGIRAGDFSADIPVSVAAGAAIAIGQYSAAAVVVVLLLLGGMLESFISSRAGKALDALARLLPDLVTVRRDGHDLPVPLAEVRVGDLLLLRPGERIAVDGEVVAGMAAVNQAPVTGESLPVDKQPGDAVFAGSLNESGWLEVRAVKVGEDTTLGQIRRMIAVAQAQKAPIERLLDRYAKVYTPVAILLGLALWWWTGDMLRAITMLIVFCPCVMVLATPTALVASIGNAAMRGNLVKRGASIEALAKVDTVAFDKTGTLTIGRPRLVKIHAIGGLAEDDLLRLAAAAEKFSEHPLGQAIVLAAFGRNLAISDPDGFDPLPASVCGRALTDVRC